LLAFVCTHVVFCFLVSLFVVFVIFGSSYV